MSTTTPKPKLTKEQEIKQLRMERGFLPQYSEYHFNKNEHEGLTLSILLLMFSGFFIGIASDFDYEIAIINILAVFFVVQFPAYLFVSMLNSRVKKRKGFYIEPAEIRTDLLFKPLGTISYDDLRSDIQNGNLFYQTAGLALGSKENRMVFHYEIGNYEAQAHVQACYALLQEHLHLQLPPLTKTTFLLLDKRYYYRNLAGKCLFSLTLSVAALYTLNLLYPFVLDGSGTSGFLFFSRILALAFWGCFTLYKLYHCASFYDKTITRLKKEYEAYDNINPGHPKALYLLFYGAAILYVLANYFVISIL